MKSADLQYPQCPIRNVLARFSDKWSLLILTTLHEKGMLRYSEICKSIPDISQKMLSTTLKRLGKMDLSTEWHSQKFLLVLNIHLLKWVKV